MRITNNGITQNNNVSEKVFFDYQYNQFAYYLLSERLKNCIEENKGSKDSFSWIRVSVSSEIETRNYYIQPTQQGIYIFLIKALQEKPISAYMQYAGKDTALFLRTPTQTILLDYINPAIQKQLYEKAFVVVAEMDNECENIIRDYKVPLKQVPEINVV